MNEDVVSTLRLLDEALARYVRPDTFPLAIRMLKPGEPIPEGLKVPARPWASNGSCAHSVRGQCRTAGRSYPQALRDRYDWLVKQIGLKHGLQP